MSKTIQRYDKPGSWEVVISFDKSGLVQEWVGVVDAQHAGEYKLRVIAQHSVSKTRGRVVVRAVVGAGAKVEIKGVIKIAPTAQETDGFLELRVLTLDESAVATAEPELEIEANNVKASHAASVGPIDVEQLIYMQSRGLAIEQAKREIVLGWLGV